MLLHLYSSVRQLTDEEIYSWLQPYLPVLADIKDGKVTVSDSSGIVNFTVIVVSNFSYSHGDMMFVKTAHHIKDVSTCIDSICESCMVRLYTTVNLKRS